MLQNQGRSRGLVMKELHRARAETTLAIPDVPHGLFLARLLLVTWEASSFQPLFVALVNPRHVIDLPVHTRTQESRAVRTLVFLFCKDKLGLRGSNCLSLWPHQVLNGSQDCPAHRALRLWHLQGLKELAGLVKKGVKLEDRALPAIFAKPCDTLKLANAARS